MMTAKEKAILMYEEFAENFGEPIYAEVEICWKDGGLCDQTIKLSSTYDGSDDDFVFYYVDSLNDLLSLFDYECKEDFFITDVFDYNN